MININNAQFHSAYGLGKQLPVSDKKEIVFCGRSNVGKSTLINKIFNRKSLARTSSVPGKTATINFYSCDDIFLVDLPGYGYAKASKDEQSRLSELLDSYFRQERNIAHIFLLIDMRRADNLSKETNDDRIMIEYLRSQMLPFTVVLTKSDKLNATEKQSALDTITEFDTTFTVFSAIKNIGTEELREIINEKN